MPPEADCWTVTREDAVDKTLHQEVEGGLPGRLARFERLAEGQPQVDR